MSLRAVLARLPQVVGGDRRALGDVRAGDEDDFGLGDVAPRVGAAVDAEDLLRRGRRRHHAQPAVVVDVGGPQRDARELAHQVGLLVGQRGAGQHGEGVAAVRRLDALDLARRAIERGRPSRSAGSRALVARQRRQQAVGMLVLHVALDALGTELPLVEREVLPRFEADDLFVLDLELDAALLAAEAAVRRARCGPVRRASSSRPQVRGWRAVRTASTRSGIDVGQSRHQAPAIPERILRQREALAAARRADVLIVRGQIRRRTVGSARRDDLVSIPSSRSTCLRSSMCMLEANGLAAPRATRRIARGSDLAVERDAELRRPLENVEELAEWQVEQREDHGDRVQLRQEDEVQPAHQMRRHRQEDPGDRHREQHDQRKQVGAELLDRQRAAIAAATPQRERHAEDHQHRGDVEHVEHERRDRAVEIEREHVHAENEGLIDLLRGAAPSRSESSRTTAET